MAPFADPHPGRVAEAVGRDGEGDGAAGPVEGGLAAPGLVRDRVEEGEPALVLPRSHHQRRGPVEVVVGRRDEPAVLLVADRGEVAERRGDHQVGAERDRGVHDVAQAAGRLGPGRQLVAEVGAAEHVATGVAGVLGRGGRRRSASPAARSVPETTTYDAALAVVRARWVSGMGSRLGPARVACPRVDTARTHPDVVRCPAVCHSRKR